MNPASLVRRVAALATRRRASTGAAELFAMTVITATTKIARGMRQLPVPAPRGAERLALEVAAAQLRRVAAEIGLASTRATGAVNADGVERETAEAKLAELVDETLQLIDAVLAKQPELRKAPEHAALPPPPPEGSDDPSTPTKISF